MSLVSETASLFICFNGVFRSLALPVVRCWVHACRAPTFSYSWVAFSIFIYLIFLVACVLPAWAYISCCLYVHVSHLPQQRHNWKCVIFQEKCLKVLKCYNFLWVQRRHNCSPAASFENCFMTLYLLKVHLQIFLYLPVTQKCEIVSCDTIVANKRYVNRAAILC